MAMRAWMVRSLDAFDWVRPAGDGPWPALSHAATTLHNISEDTSRRRGETVWVGVISGRSVVVAWEWAELRRGVLVLGDPCTIVTNLRFLSDNDELIDGRGAIVCTNRIVHSIDWQSEVLQSIREVG